MTLIFKQVWVDVVKAFGHQRAQLGWVSGAVAQWLEQGTHNPWVVGSIPTGPTLGFLELNDIGDPLNVVEFNQFLLARGEFGRPVTRGTA